MFEKKMIIVAASAVCVLGTALSAQAASYNYTLSPADLATAVEKTNDPSLAFGYDWDEDAPIGVNTTGAPGFGTSSFWSDVQGSAAGGPRDYTSLRIFPDKALQLGGPLTIGDLSKISYWTQKGDVNSIDWQIKIYTAPESGDTSWYRNRFNFVRGNASDLAWNEYSTDTLNVSDILNKTSGNYTYPADTLASLTSTYGSEKIMWIDIIAGYATNSPPVDSYLDGITITETGSGNTATINLVPEPASLALLGLGGLAMLKRGTKRHG